MTISCFESKLNYFEPHQTVSNLSPISSQASVCELQVSCSSIDLLHYNATDNVDGHVTNTDTPLFYDLLETYGITDQYVSAQQLAEWTCRQRVHSSLQPSLGETRTENTCECMFSDILCHTGSAKHLFDTFANESTGQSYDALVPVPVSTQISRADAVLVNHTNDTSRLLDSRHACHDDDDDEPISELAVWYASFPTPHAQYASLLRVLDVQH